MTVFDIATKEIAGGIEGVVRQVPAGIRKRVVKRSFIRNAESAAKGGFRIAEDIPRETDARSEVVVVALTSEVAVVKPPGPQTPAIWACAMASGVSQPGKPAGVLASLI
jgi:hypothetical protein